MNHNIVVVEDKEYKAVKAVNHKTCNGCSFSSGGFECIHPKTACIESERSDGVHVIFKPHYNAKLVAKTLRNNHG